MNDGLDKLREPCYRAVTELRLVGKPCDAPDALRRQPTAIQFILPRRLHRIDSAAA